MLDGFNEGWIEFESGEVGAQPLHTKARNSEKSSNAVIQFMNSRYPHGVTPRVRHFITEVLRAP